MADADAGGAAAALSRASFNAASREARSAFSGEGITFDGEDIAFGGHDVAFNGRRVPVGDRSVVAGGETRLLGCKCVPFGDERLMFRRPDVEVVRQFIAFANGRLDARRGR